MGLEPRLVCTITLAALLAALPSGSPVLYVNPERAEPGGEFTAEGGARDHDVLGTSTWSTRALSRTCTRQGGCAGVSASANVWTGFPAGFRPRSIGVYWKAAASGALFGGMSQVRAVIEYSTGLDEWTVLGRFASNDAFDAMPPTISQAVLASGTDAASLRVRARLEVEMISCPNAQCPAELPNPSNISGQIWVSDIRLEVEEPTLLVEPVRPRLGQEVQVTVLGAPSDAQIAGWTFTTARGSKKTTRTEELASAAWTFPAENGTVRATVRLRGQRQLEGRTFELTAPIAPRQSR